MNATTRYCAVYGHPVKHSASPAFQNAGLAALGLNWRYLAFDVPPEQLREAILGAQRMRFIGVNLTVPHKLLAVGMVDALDESARSWGAVNTIRFEARTPSGEWKPLALFPDEVPPETRSQGFNTDAGAITRSVEENLAISLRGARALLLGAGGAGRTAALKLASDGVAELFLVNRTRSKAEDVAREIRERFPATRCTLDYPSGPVDLVLNATSLGLKAGDPLPYDSARFDLSKAGAVYDMIYRPAETPLLCAAKAAGCRAANGVGMLLYQGVKALEIWTGQPAPVAVMRAALVKNVYG
ncbi:MAG: shikimate dehydrogenase [Verrucomicrobia bacterium]|nr:shikimate dehydrogenase [Verrucomicrobiota bacterium]